MRKAVLVRISLFKCTSRIRTQKLRCAQKTYLRAQAVYVRKNPYNLRTQTDTAVLNKSTRKEEKN